ncbi:MAG: hypothetical protein MZV64_15365 [Ignavibacteriales bacterium]|nr:hypothetical protein [Ignavibacteriales bacterium]
MAVVVVEPDAVDGERLEQRAEGPHPLRAVALVRRTDALPPVGCGRHAARRCRRERRPGAPSGSRPRASVLNSAYARAPAAPAARPAAPRCSSRPEPDRVHPEFPKAAAAVDDLLRDAAVDAAHGHGWRVPRTGTSRCADECQHEHEIQTSTQMATAGPPAPGTHHHSPPGADERVATRFYSPYSTPRPALDGRRARLILRVRRECDMRQLSQAGQFVRRCGSCSSRPCVAMLTRRRRRGGPSRADRIQRPLGCARASAWKPATGSKPSFIWSSQTTIRCRSGTRRLGARRAARQAPARVGELLRRRRVRSRPIPVPAN